MPFANYFIEDDEIVLPYLNEDISVGDEIIISNEVTDLSFRQDWYQDGYKIYEIFDENEFGSIYSGIESAVASIIGQELNLSVSDFSLTDYHKFVHSDADHYKVVSRTRDLYSEEFNFPILDNVGKLGGLVQTQLTDVNPNTKQKTHIIVRINRPNSFDFNPPHKDIYEAYDNHIALDGGFMNFWIPICGVTKRSSLPIVPGSHLLAESGIERSLSGALVGGNRYRVNLILQWGGLNQLTRANLKQREVLCFSPHLIHGLAINQEPDQTRVALEFRLFEDVEP